MSLGKECMIKRWESIKFIRQKWLFNFYHIMF